MKTISAKAVDIKRKWYLIDANNRVLGDVAVEAANLLRGKGKVTYTPHIDNGDHVVVTDALGKPIVYNKREPLDFGLICCAPGIHRAAVERLAERATKLLSEA